jgi:MFS family permease
MSVTQAGQTVQTFTFTATFTSVVISLLIKYTKHYKRFMVLGTCLYTFGLVLMMWYRTEESSQATIIATQVFLGIGGALTHVPAQLGVQASASHSEVAAATALFMTSLEIGGAVGSAISGAIWSANIPVKLRQYLPEETRDQASDIFGNISLASGGWPMGSPTRMAINQAYQETMTKILTVAVCVSLPCIILALCMKNFKLDEIDQGVKGVVIGAGKAKADDDDDEAGTASQPLMRTSLSRDTVDDDEELGLRAVTPSTLSGPAKSIA